MRARRRGWAAVLLAVTGGLAGLGPVLLVTAAPAWAYTADAQMVGTSSKDYDFNPRSIEIFVDDWVHWQNVTSADHTVTSDPGSPVAFDSDEVAPGKTPKDGYERRFNKAGEYHYRCKIHPIMKGVVVVTERNATTTTTMPPTTATTAPSTTTTAPATTTTEPPTTTTDTTVPN